MMPLFKESANPAISPYKCCCWQGVSFYIRYFRRRQYWYLNRLINFSEPELSHIHLDSICNLSKPVCLTVKLHKVSHRTFQVHPQNKSNPNSCVWVAPTRTATLVDSFSPKSQIGIFAVECSGAVVFWIRTSHLSSCTDARDQRVQ